MTIQAKFSGTCTICGSRFPVGAAVEWTKGQGSRHAKCRPSARSFTVDWGLSARRPAGRWNASRSDADSSAWADRGYGDGDLS